MQARVLKSTGNWYSVKGQDGVYYRCRIRGKLRTKGLKTTNPVAAGDFVEIQIEHEEEGNIASIVEILPRKNYIIRKSVNLSKEAQSRGLDPSRLVFAKRMDMSSHLARQKVADLFLDTLPYNAHTTASDALMAGLPVISICGKSFSSRVAASLLNDIAMSKLVCFNFQEYHDIALKMTLTDVPLEQCKASLKINIKDKFWPFSPEVQVNALESLLVNI